jgi:hypothetical protein
MSPLVTLLRRTVWIVLLAAAGAAAWAWWRERMPENAPAAPPEWPPIPTVTPTPVAAADTAWTIPDADGSCPDGFPVKVKVASGIYHVPGGRFHERTRPDRCYATAVDAEADGYRRSKT